MILLSTISPGNATSCSRQSDEEQEAGTGPSLFYTKLWEACCSPLLLSASLLLYNRVARASKNSTFQLHRVAVVGGCEFRLEMDEVQCTCRAANATPKINDCMKKKNVLRNWYIRGIISCSDGLTSSVVCTGSDIRESHCKKYRLTHSWLTFNSNYCLR